MHILLADLLSFDSMTVVMAITYCIFFCQVFEGSVADDRLVGITVHQAAVIIASLHMGLVTAQWVRYPSRHPLNL